MTRLNDIVAENIIAHRIAMDLSQRGLGRKLGLPNGGATVSSWERGRTLPGAYSLCMLADIFGCTVDELLGRK